MTSCEAGPFPPRATACGGKVVCVASVFGWGAASSPGGELGGPGGRPRCLAATSATGIGRLVAWRQHRARSAIFELCSMRWTCFARGPYDTRGRTAKQGPKSRPCRAKTLRLPSPHTKQVHPIEHLAPASPTVQALGWQGSRGRAGLASAVPSVQALGRWAGADLTAAGLAPTGPSVQGLIRSGLPREGALCTPRPCGWPRRSRSSRRRRTRGSLRPAGSKATPVVPGAAYGMPWICTSHWGLRRTPLGFGQPWASYPNPSEADQILCGLSSADQPGCGAQAPTLSRMVVSFQPSPIWRGMPSFAQPA
ncbi:hypothetical protein LV75_006663 [Actinokineospora diospyrosa]|uniref:Uncharacterized protein n=1 Tax=Actinokineospora diospyrosa TaxID=103728 RepID=A0ABT1INL3_9PSEU|nr:hypothetical protein [Actinokineospora diospyrosa]